GAWDNGPYFHDGRYRTLEEVLDHTWLNTSDGNRAANLFMNGATLYDPPDNASNAQLYNQLSVPGIRPNNGIVDSTDPYEMPRSPPPARAKPAGRISASSWLAAQSTTVGVNGKDAVLDFLRGVSSQTDLGPTLHPLNFAVSGKLPNCTKDQLSWQTLIPIS